MSTQPLPAGRISAARLATLLGSWRRRGPHHGAEDLAAALALVVHDGRLPSGTRLPSERELTAALGVSRTLVGAAWDRLRAAGLVASRRGSGSWITVPGPGHREVLAPAADLIDLARASPPAIAGLVGAVDSARSRITELLSGPGYTELGVESLRERIAARYTARGLPTTAAQVLVTNGAHHAWVLALRLMVGPGDRVLVEQPSYPNALDAVRAAHAIAVPVSVEDGWDPDGIDAAIRQSAPRLAYLIADFHNPTGRVMCEQDRARLGAALVRSRTPVVVDETLVELDLDGGTDMPAPFAAFTADGPSRNWCLSIGSAAKAYWGGLRIGWIRAAEDMIARLASARAALDLGSPVLDQLVVDELMAAPPDALDARRARLAAARDTLAGLLREHCPQWSFTVPRGGLALWCGLPGPMSTRLAVAAINHGVHVAPGARFGVHGGFERSIRLPYTAQADRLEDAVRRLALAAHSVRDSGVAGDPLRGLQVT